MKFYNDDGTLIIKDDIKINVPKTEFCNEGKSYKEYISESILYLFNHGYRII